MPVTASTCGQCTYHHDWQSTGVSDSTNIDSVQAQTWTLKLKQPNVTESFFVTISSYHDKGFCRSTADLPHTGSHLTFLLTFNTAATLFI